MTVRWLVSGQVQGVGFRAFVARRALELGITGAVRNLPDGRVEVVAQGSEAAIAGLKGLVSRGPRLARVSHVENTDISDEVTIFNSFDIM